MDTTTDRYQHKALLDIAMAFVNQEGHLYEEISHDLFSSYRAVFI